MITRVIHSILLLALLVSCSNTDAVNEPSLDANSEKWALVKMTGSFTGSETTGEDMEWQEYYIFNSDATFFKSRDRDGTVKEAFGTYKKETLEGEEYLELKYTSGVDIISNCTGNAIEFLSFKKGDVLIGNSNACDGPGLEYEQLKK